MADSSPPAPAPLAVRAAAPPCEEALRCYEEGIAARRQNDWEKARALLLESWNLQHDFQTAANLGEMELKVGRHREAFEHLTYFLKEGPASVPAADRALGQTMLDQARASLGTIRVVVPPEAELYVDGQKIDYLPGTRLILVEQGRRRIEARDHANRSVAQIREVPAGSVVDVNLTVPPVIEGPDKWIVGAGVTATALGVAMGTGFAIASEVKRQERDRAPLPCYRTAGDCELYNAPARARDRFLTASLISFLAAGAIGSGTLVYSLAKRPTTTSREVKATATVGVGWVGGAVDISW